MLLPNVPAGLVCTRKADPGASRSSLWGTSHRDVSLVEKTQSFSQVSVQLSRDWIKSCHRKEQARRYLIRAPELQVDLESIQKATPPGSFHTLICSWAGGIYLCRVACMLGVVGTYQISHTTWSTTMDLRAGGVADYRVEGRRTVSGPAAPAGNSFLKHSASAWRAYCRSFSLFSSCQARRKDRTRVERGCCDQQDHQR